MIDETKKTVKVKEAKKEIAEIKKESKKEHAELIAKNQQLTDLFIKNQAEKERSNAQFIISCVSLLINLVCWLCFFVIFK